MDSIGKGGLVLPAAIVPAATLPVTGVKNVVEIALAVAAGLAAWAVAYMVTAQRANR
jgi:hypothetical protein